MKQIRITIMVAITLSALIILCEPKQAKGAIKVNIVGSERCAPSNLDNLEYDVSALLGKGSLSSMDVECRSGKLVALGIDAEVPWSIRLTSFDELPSKLLSISRRISAGFPQQSISIGWVVKNDRRSESLAKYNYWPSFSYEGFTFLDVELVKKGKYPSGCKSGLEENIVAIVVKRTGLQPFTWVGRSIITCVPNGFLWSLALDFPIEKVPPPFIENRILPSCELLFSELENVAGKYPYPLNIPLVVRSENVSVGSLCYSKGKISLWRHFSDIETLKRKALIYRIEKEEKKRKKLEFIIQALQN